MPRLADAIVTGFVKSSALLERSLAPLRRLRQEGVLRNILYVTWDGADLDAFVAPLANMSDITLVRVPKPSVLGTPDQRGVVYQVMNLDAALSLIAEDDALVLKIRPDFVADTGFLRRKITAFDALCALPREPSVQGVTMPAPVFDNKIWVPWADANQPFFYEDAAFLGTKWDLCKLATIPSRADIDMIAEVGTFAHVVRYARIFVPRYNLFANYLRNYRFFGNDLDYRLKLVPHLLNDAFFWHVIVAHAWILHSQFHVDAGEQGTLSFYSNAVNRNANWPRPEALRNAPPYDQIAAWKTKPGVAMNGVTRVYGRLVDDAWQSALFTQDLPDFPRATLRGLLEHVAGSNDGRLGKIENDFYRSTAALHRHCWPAHTDTGLVDAVREAS